MPRQARLMQTIASVSPISIKSMGISRQSVKKKKKNKTFRVLKVYYYYLYSERKRQKESRKKRQGQGETETRRGREAAMQTERDTERAMSNA